MLVAIFVLLLVADRSCSVAEMGLSRMTKPKAASLADKGEKSAKALAAARRGPGAVGQPAAADGQHLPDRAGHAHRDRRSPACSAPAGVVVGVVLNVIVFFVLAEAVPKTYAVLYPERAALITARPRSGWCRSRRCADLPRARSG